MTEISDTIKKEIELETQIRKIIFDDNGAEVSIQYKIADFVEVDIITYNPRHNTFFLFDTYKSLIKDKISILEDILNLLKHKIKPTHYLTYKITWLYGGKFYTSHFGGYSLEDVCKKFYFKNNPFDYIIYSAELMPSA
jgi:hypothetical protein